MDAKCKLNGEKYVSPIVETFLVEPVSSMLAESFRGSGNEKAVEGEEHQWV